MKRSLPGPLYGGYLIQNFLARQIVASLDFGLRLLRPVLVKRTTLTPASLLLCNIAHLGDAVMTTALLPALKKRYPDVKIGMLVGSWAKPLLEGHPLIDNLHTLDHWKVDRSTRSLFSKYCAYKRSFAQVRPEISGYDAAVDLNYHFPSSAYLLFRAGIPYRTGYETAGLAPLYTHPHIWQPANKSSILYGSDLLKNVFPIDEADLEPTLPDKVPFATLQERFSLPSQDYIVVHMSSGNSMKDWPLSSWEKLFRLLHKETLILTGRGPRDCLQAEQFSTFPSIINTVNQLTLPELVALIRHARLLVSVDTAAGHIASATKTPSVLLYSGIYPEKQWRPWGKEACTLTKKTACHPCYRNTGCRTMSCLRGVTPQQVYEAIVNQLSP